MNDVNGKALLIPLKCCLFCFAQGIGDSGQGAVNALLFVFFTKRVRQRLLHYLVCGCCSAQFKSQPFSVDVTGNVQNYYHTPSEPAASPTYFSHTGAAYSSDDSVY